MRRLAALGISTALVVTGAASAHAATGSRPPVLASDQRRRQREPCQSRRVNPDVGNDPERRTAVGGPGDGYLAGVLELPPNSPLLSASHLFVISGGAINIRRVERPAQPEDQAVLSRDDNFYKLALGHGEVIAGGSGCESVRDPGGYVFAYNSTTGKELWRWIGPAVGDMVESGTLSSSQAAPSAVAPMWTRSTSRRLDSVVAVR